MSKFTPKTRITSESEPTLPVTPSTTPVPEIPIEAQRMNLVLCPHGTIEEANFACESISRILRPELKGVVKIVLWHELAGPIDFPRTLEEMKQCHSYYAKEQNLYLPRVNWEQELKRDSPSASGLKALEIINREMMKDTEKQYTKLLTSNAVKLHTSGFDPYYRFLHRLESDDWDFEHRIERAPPTALFHQLAHVVHHRALQKPLMEGHAAEALRSRALYNFHLTFSADLRDEAYAKLLVPAFDREKPIVNICTRGIGHGGKLTELLERAGIPVYSQLSEVDKQSHQVESWKFAIENKIFTPCMTLQLACEIFDEVATLLINNKNGFSNSDRNDLAHMIESVDPKTFVDWLEEVVEGRKQTLKELTLGSFVWLSRQPQVKSHPSWLPVCNALQEKGAFTAIYD